MKYAALLTLFAANTAQAQHPQFVAELFQDGHNVADAKGYIGPDERLELKMPGLTCYVTSDVTSQTMVCDRDGIRYEEESSCKARDPKAMMWEHEQTTYGLLWYCQGSPFI